MSASSAASVEEFRELRGRILETIVEACRRTGRDPAAVTIVAVSKTVSAGRVQAAVDAGFSLLGENRVQEAAGKIPLVSGARWHLVGPLQSNKARRAVELFEVVESVDSVDLARRLSRLVEARDGGRGGRGGRGPGGPGLGGRAGPSGGEGRGGPALGIYLQVNVDRDPAKAGFLPDEIGPALPGLAALPGLSLLGLMTVGRLVPRAEDARPTFAALRRLSEALREEQPSLGAGLSMGMTDDYAVAVEEGATVLRLGRVIFGERQAG